MSGLVPHHSRRGSRRSRRGSVYLLVLSTTTLIAALVSGTVYAQTKRIRAERASADASKARLAAESGIEVLRATIKQDVNWRGTHTSGRWSTNLVMGDAKVDLDVVDTVDGNLANCTHDGVLLTATARVGDAEQIISATLVAKPSAIDALQYAMLTAGQLHVTAAGSLIMGSGTASTNGSLRNEQTIEGNVRAASVNAAGTVFGTVTSGVAATSLPTSASAEAVALLGTSLPTSNKYSDVALSSSSNPFGTENARGVYVIRNTKDVELKKMTVSGTLVVITPGNQVTITRDVLMTSTNPALPVLVVDGDLVIAGDAVGSINGLVHATGKISMDGAAPIRGVVIAGSTATTDAVAVRDEQKLTYNSALFTYAPVGYTKSVEMVLQPGSYQRVIK